MLASRFKNVWLAIALMAAAVSASAADSQILQQALATLVPEKAANALAKIPDSGRKLLAARSYLRSHASLDQRWSWNESEIAAYEGSADQKALLADIARIAEHFNAANPGYSLYTNTQVRSLDKQLAAWNSNGSVAVAASNLLLAMENEARISISTGNPKLPEQLKAWLGAHSPKPSPNLAAPGLSAHGQMHAIDFQITKAGALIAPADSSKVDTIWRSMGWEAKLKASIAAVGLRFAGPLTSPDEPWHYSYTPGNKEPGNAVISK
jgi:hypothetical protein